MGHVGVGGVSCRGGVGCGVSCRGGSCRVGVGHVGVEVGRVRCVMWGTGVGHTGVGWVAWGMGGVGWVGCVMQGRGGSCRGGVGWVMLGWGWMGYVGSGVG